MFGGANPFARPSGPFVSVHTLDRKCMKIKEKRADYVGIYGEAYRPSTLILHLSRLIHLLARR